MSDDAPSPQRFPSAARATANPGAGLAPAHAAATADLAPRRRFRPRNLAIQLVGTALSAALLVWVIAQALGEENAAAWARLGDASPALIAALVLTTAGNIAANGMIFHAVARPLWRFHPVYLVALNAIATLLSSIPFKLGVLIRGLVHHRRDGMPFKLIVGWFSAVGGLGFATLVPIAALGVWRSSADALWFAGAFATLTVVHAAAIALSRIAARDAGVVSASLARLSLGSWRFAQHPAATLGHAAWRTLDFALLAARFWAAARILGFQVTPEQALLLGTTFFLISVTAPSGNLGVREAATVGIAKAVGIEGSIAPLALLVSLTELATALALAVPALAIVRPDRIVKGRDVIPVEAGHTAPAA